MGFLDLLPDISQKLRESYCDAKHTGQSRSSQLGVGGDLLYLTIQLKNLCSAISLHKSEFTGTVNVNSRNN